MKDQQEGRAYPQYLTRKDVKDQFHISYPTILKYEREGKFKGYRLGRRILYKKQQIEEALEERSFSHA